VYVLPMPNSKTRVGKGGRKSSLEIFRFSPLPVRALRKLEGGEEIKKKKGGLKSSLKKNLNDRGEGVV